MDNVNVCVFIMHVPTFSKALPGHKHKMDCAMQRGPLQQFRNFPEEGNIKGKR
jgi:hypothetical protein